jgi:cation transport ATPase
LVEDGKSPFIRKIIQELIRRVLDSVSGAVGQPLKRVVKKVAGLFAGILVALLGLTLLTIGVIKGLALYMPSWMAWILVGVIVLLAGLVLALASR